jgi:hypothetical protein
MSSDGRDAGVYGAYFTVRPLARKGARDGTSWMGKKVSFV